MTTHDKEIFPSFTFRRLAEDQLTQNSQLQAAIKSFQNVMQISWKHMLIGRCTQNTQSTLQSVCFLSVFILQCTHCSVLSEMYESLATDVIKLQVDHLVQS